MRVKVWLPSSHQGLKIFQISKIIFKYKRYLKVKDLCVLICVRRRCDLTSTQVTGEDSFWENSQIRKISSEFCFNFLIGTGIAKVK